MNAENRNPVTYRHLRAIRAQKKGGNLPDVTLRFEIDQDNEKLFVSWATSSPNDQFSYQKGRDIADRTSRQGEKRHHRYIKIAYDRDLSLVDNVRKNVPIEMHSYDQLTLEALDYIEAEYERMLEAIADLYRANHRFHNSRRSWLWRLKKWLVSNIAR